MERPTGVTILAVLAFIGAAFLAIGSIALMVGGALLSNARATGPGAGMLLGLGGAVLGGICLVLAVIYVFMAVGLLKLQNWARIVTIVFVGLGLLSALMGLLSSFAHVFPVLIVRNIIVVAIDVWILIYLFKPHVKQAFGATSL
jgi:hypothetical protein